MRKVYSGIAWLIAGLVVVQAAAIALGFGGMMHFVDEGGVVDKGLTESRTPGQLHGRDRVPDPRHRRRDRDAGRRPGAAGVSWFTKVRGASWWAAGLFVLIVLQGMVGYSIKDLPYLGVLHGGNALAVVLVAVVCARRTRSAAVSPVSEPATADVTREAEPTIDAGGREPAGRGTVVRRLAALSLLVLVAAGAGVAWWNSRLGTYSVMTMGHQHGLSHAAATTSVTELVTDPAQPADVRVVLVARQERFVVPGGQPVEGYTIGGTSPGPVIRARQGQLVEVTLVNESVADGVALHWHGVDVPNAEDGVAGITQDAVPVGGRHVYRFVADDAGTYWYHSHQMSHEQVERGLLGASSSTRRRTAAAGRRPARPAPSVCRSARAQRPRRG